ncbi:MAG: hypothetical protein CSA86_06295, partial [Arcobacter sp.]
MIQSIANQVGTSLASSALTGNNLNLDLNSIAKGAITAGVMSYAGGLVDVSKLNIDNMSKDVVNTLKDTTIQTTVNSSVYGTSFKDGFVTNLALNSTDLAFKNIGDYEVSQLNKGKQNFLDGSIGKTLAHATVGGIS